MENIEISKEVLADPKFMPWLHDVTTEGYKQNVVIDRAQGQLIELLYREGCTATYAVERINKVLIRVDAINENPQ